LHDYVQQLLGRTYEVRVRTRTIPVAFEALSTDTIQEAAVLKQQLITIHEITHDSNSLFDAEIPFQDNGLTTWQQAGMFIWDRVVGLPSCEDLIQGNTCIMLADFAEAFGTSILSRKARELLYQLGDSRFELA
jgi:hypothetical protein